MLVFLPPILSLLSFLGRKWLPPAFLMENFPVSGAFIPCFNLHQSDVKVAWQLLTKSPKWFLLLKLGKERRYSQRPQDLNQMRLSEMNLEVFLRSHWQLGQWRNTMFLMRSGTSVISPSWAGFSFSQQPGGLEVYRVSVPKCRLGSLWQLSERKGKTSIS